MSYATEISRNNPTCFVFLIDQSLSMDDPFPSLPRMKKADGVADAINRLLQTLVLRCAKAEGVRDYYHVSVIGYGGNPSNVAPAFGGKLAGRDMVPISEIANNPLRLEQRTKQVPDGAGGLVDQTIEFPVWFEPVADGFTPMCSALNVAENVVRDFLERSPRCYPPMVIHITDGESSDGDPEPHAAKVRQLASEDGNVLLFNVHVSSSNARPEEFQIGLRTCTTTFPASSSVCRARCRRHAGHCPQGGHPRHRIDPWLRFQRRHRLGDPLP